MTIDASKRLLTFAKGHGLGNDFVILVDEHGLVHLSISDIRALCDRRLGIGGDGVLRAVRAAHVPEWTGDPTLWFMDYRNADGSVAEMCGNGLRVFVRYLVDFGYMPARAEVATRAGVRATRALEGDVSIEAGIPRFRDPVVVELSGRRWPATNVDLGNPHAVVLVAPDELAALDLAKPTWEPRSASPNGTNVEFVAPPTPTGESPHDNEINMRVHERGSGETLSCGTGIVASAAAFATSQGKDHGTYTVHTPGGTASVELRRGKPAVLTAPAVITFTGTVSLAQLRDGGAGLRGTIGTRLG